MLLFPASNRRNTTQGPTKKVRGSSYRIPLQDSKVYLDESTEQKPLPAAQEEHPATVLEFTSSDRGFAHWLMQSYTVEPGQTLHLPGGARLVFQNVDWRKKDRIATFSFLAEDMDGVAGRMFTKWLIGNLKRRPKSVKRIAINEKTASLQNIEKILQRELAKETSVH